MTNDRNGRGAGMSRRHEESSVVFSLDSLRTLAQADAEATARARQAGLPSFSGGDLGGLVAPRRPEAVMPIAQPVLAPSPSNLPLVLMIGILLVTTIALSAYIVIDPRPRVVVTQIAAPDPSEAAGSVEDTEIELVPDRTTPAREPAVVASREPNAATQVATPKKPRGTPRVASDRAREPEVAKLAKPDTKARELPIECVLDPHAAGCGTKASVPVEAPPKVATIDPNLPETLGSAALRSGIAGVKEAAKSCGAKHGGSAGEKIKVKLSIVGATGAVQSTAAEGAHVGTALGNCVAAALKKASFPHFRKQVIGLEYTITL